MGLPQPEVDAFLEKLQRAFFEGGATLVEINPLGVVDGKLVAMDAKLVLDDHNRAAKAFEAELEEARSALGWDTPQLCRVLEQLQAELTRYLTE